MNKREAGRLGGLNTRLKHGSEHMSRIGKLGGRPALPTIEQLMAQTSPGALDKEGGIGYPRTGAPGVV